jgi:hypothetical protein
MLISEQALAHRALVTSLTRLSAAWMQAKTTAAELAAAGGLDELDAYFALDPDVGRGPLTQALSVVSALGEVMATGNREDKLNLIRETVAVKKAERLASAEAAHAATHLEWICATCEKAQKGLVLYRNAEGKPLCEKCGKKDGKAVKAVARVG